MWVKGMIIYSGQFVLSTNFDKWFSIGNKLFPINYNWNQDINYYYIHG